MTQIAWNFSGKLAFLPQFSQTVASYPGPTPLHGVRVEIASKESKLDPDWNVLGEVFTKHDGSFSLIKTKDRSDRYFRLRIMFKDDELKLYPANDGLFHDLLNHAPFGLEEAVDVVDQALAATSRLAFDVDWYTLIKDDEKRSGPNVDFGTLTFQANGHLDLSHHTARRHADIWFLVKKMIAELRAADVPFATGKTLAIKHPHSEPLVKDGTEQSYCNPYNNTVFLLQNSVDDHFNAETVLHEVMHLWTYQNSKGEDGLAWQLLVHGSTHEGRQKKAWVAFHEAFAEWAAAQLYQRIYQQRMDVLADAELDSRPTPFSRDYLRSLGIASLDDLDHFEHGWFALFNALTCPLPDSLEPDNGSPYMTYSGTVAAAIDATWTTTARTSGPEILKSMMAQPSGTFSKVPTKDELNLDTFLDRLVAISAVTTREQADAVKALLQTRPPAPARPKDKAAAIRPLHQAPITSRTAAKPASRRK